MESKQLGGIIIMFDIQEDIREVKECPWCGEKHDNSVLYETEYDCKVRKCKNCGFVYADHILNDKGLKKYWSNYSSSVHCVDEESIVKRKQMYGIEFNHIMRYLSKKANVLDVGCGEGGFLDLFKEEGCNTCGVEYGEEAAKSASMSHKIYIGEFPDIDIEETFDLIIFRGSIQYLINPKSYFEKAINLLKPNGKIFISSSPNSQSICFNLFLKMHNQPVCVTDYYMYSVDLLKKYFESKGMFLIANNFFYEETPYCNFEEDFEKVTKAYKMKKANKPIDFKSPAYWDNMLSLVFMKIE